MRYCKVVSNTVWQITEVAPPKPAEEGSRGVSSVMYSTECMPRNAIAPIPESAPAKEAVGAAKMKNLTCECQSVVVCGA